MLYEAFTGQFNSNNRFRIKRDACIKQCEPDMLYVRHNTKIRISCITESIKLNLLFADEFKPQYDAYQNPFPVLDLIGNSFCPIFETIKCDCESNTKSLVKLYKYLFCFVGDNQVVKWYNVADGKCYYVSLKAIFDKDKKLVLCVNETQSRSSVFIDNEVTDKRDWMSKYIMDVYIPAWTLRCKCLHFIHRPEIVFTDMSETYMDTRVKYMAFNELNKYLNEKIHNLADVCDFI